MDDSKARKMTSKMIMAIVEILRDNSSKSDEKDYVKFAGTSREMVEMSANIALFLFSLCAKGAQGATPEKALEVMASQLASRMEGVAMMSDKYVNAFDSHFENLVKATPETKIDEVDNPTKISL